MRLSVPATAVGLCLIGGLGLATPPGQPPAADNARFVASLKAPSFATAPAAPPAAAPADGSMTDAARHAKRTACLKEAKARKLVGAERNAFIKDCIAR